MTDEMIEEGTSAQDGLPEQHGVERFSPRQELISLADEWIAAASDERERQALYATKAALLAAMDEVE